MPRDSEVHQILLSLRVECPSTIMRNFVPLMPGKTEGVKSLDKMVECVEVGEFEGFARRFLCHRKSGNRGMT